MLRGTKGFLYSTLGAVMLLAAGCANEPPAPPAPAGTSSTGIIPTPAEEPGTPQEGPNAPTAQTHPSQTVDSAAGGVSNRKESPPKAANPAPKAPKAPKATKGPVAPELPASSVLQESGKTSMSSTESAGKPKEPATKIVDPPTVGAGPAKSDGERAAPMLPEPIDPPTISAEPTEETKSPAAPQKRLENDLRAPSGISEPVRSQK